MVTDDADPQGEADQPDRHGKMQQDPPKEDMVGGQGLAVVFKGHTPLVDRLAVKRKKRLRRMVRIGEKLT